MSAFPDFLEAHGPPVQVQPVPPEAVERVHEQLGE
jgi:hypothetical protein